MHVESGTAAFWTSNATRAQERSADLTRNAVRTRHRVGAATLVELSEPRAAEVTAASALVNARFNLIFQQSPMSYYTGTLDPACRCSTDRRDLPRCDAS